MLSFHKNTPKKLSINRDAETKEGLGGPLTGITIEIPIVLSRGEMINDSDWYESSKNHILSADFCNNKEKRIFFLFFIFQNFLFNYFFEKKT